MRFIVSLFIAVTSIFANIGVVVDVVGKSTLTRDDREIDVVQKLQLQKHDTIQTGKNAKVKIFFQDNTAVSLGKNTSFEIDSYIYDATPKSEIKFKVVRGFFKAVTGSIGKVAPNRFQLQTKNATIGIRGTVFIANVGVSKDIVICTDGEVLLKTLFGVMRLPAGKLTEAKRGIKPHVNSYSEAQKKKLIEEAGWNGSMTLKELILYIKRSFQEPLRSQLLATLENILNKDSDEYYKYLGKVKHKNADEKSFIDDIKINGREFDSLEQIEIEFYPEDLQDKRVVVQGLLESEDKSIPLETLYVEITIDGGATWSRARGQAEWEWSFIPKLGETYEFSLRVIQDIKLKYTPIHIVGASLKGINFIKPVFKKPNKKALEADSPHLPMKKEVTTEPVVVKFRRFTPKETTTESVVVKFRRFTPKETITEPVVVKFRHFTPKEITTEQVVVKFK